MRHLTRKSSTHSAGSASYSHSHSHSHSPSTATITSPFPTLRLTGADKQVLRAATHNFLAEGVRDFEYFTKEHVNQRLPKDRWKLLRERKDLRAYMMKNPPLIPGASKDEAPATTLVTVGTVIGSIADCVYGALSPTVDHLRVTAACLDGGNFKSAILHVLEDPTHEDPFRTMQVRWYVRELPFPFCKFARRRDATFIEATGMTTFSSGERIGFHILHSLTLPELAPLPAYHRVELSCIALWRQHSDQRSELFVKTFTELRDSPVTMPMELRALTGMVFDFAGLAEVGRLKKLLWLFCQRNLRSHHRMPPHAHPTKICSSCGKRLAPTHPTTCALCGFVICVSCRVTKRMAAISQRDEVCEFRAHLCRPCWHVALSTDAYKIACEEVESMVEASWHDSNSPVWPRVNESMWSADSMSTSTAGSVRGF